MPIDLGPNPLRFPNLSDAHNPVDPCGRLTLHEELEFRGDVPKSPLVAGDHTDAQNFVHWFHNYLLIRMN
jgi:hypothetical protein